MHETDGYRDSLAVLKEKFGEKRFITTREIAELDDGVTYEIATPAYQAAMRRAKARYNITAGGLPIEKLARLRALM